MTSNGVPLLPHATIELHSIGLFDEKQYVGHIKDFDIQTTAALQTKTAQQILQYVTSYFPQYLIMKKSIIWISDHQGIIYIGEGKEQIEYGFFVHYVLSE